MAVYPNQIMAKGFVDEKLTFLTHNVTNGDCTHAIANSNLIPNSMHTTSAHCNSYHKCLRYRCAHEQF